MIERTKIAGTVRIDVHEITDLLGRMHPTKVAPAVAKGLRRAVLWMIRDVVLNRLLGQYLHRRTGTLIRSVTASPPASPQIVGTGDGLTVRDWYGTNLDYGRAHELGFSGRVQVPGHTRRLVPRVTSKKVARAVRKRIAAQHKRFAFVRPHNRIMVIRARYYLRDSMRAVQYHGIVNREVTSSVLTLLRTGRA